MRNNKVPSPGTDPNIVKLTDEGIASYIEFPPDTIFLESVAHNVGFKKGVAYVPAQRRIRGQGKDEHPQTFIYEIQPGQTHAKELFGPLVGPDGSTAITIFGSALTSEGRLHLACFNRNSILDYDLKHHLPVKGKPAPCLFEVQNVPSPNDVCVDPEQENILYVAGGTFSKLCCGSCYTFTNAARAQVFKIEYNALRTDTSVTSIKDGLDALGGVEKVGNQLWTAQLYDVFTLDTVTAPKYDKRVRWRGNDGQGNVWLADNIDLFEPRGSDKSDGKWILCPAYTTAPKGMVNFIYKKNHVSSLAFFGGQIATAFMKGESIREALLDPEVSLSISNTFIKEGETPPPIRLFLMSPDGKQCVHFEIDLRETRANNEAYEPDPVNNPGKLRHFFNEQVTHCSHLIAKDGSQGYMVCVSFEQPRILLLKDDPFQEQFSRLKKAAVY